MRSVSSGRLAKEGRHVLVLSSSLLTDRMLVFSDVLDILSKRYPLEVWATSAEDGSGEPWQRTPANVVGFPHVVPFKEFPYNYLRRLNEFSWDFRLRPPSRLSAMRHIRNKQQRALVRSLKLPARLVAGLRQEARLEDWLESVLASYPRSAEALERLRADPPALVLSTGPFWFWEPAVTAAAKSLGIPTIALIPSWDNISTKGRMTQKYDGYVVWSEGAAGELHAFYPASRSVPVKVVGAPQYDVFFQDRFYESRESFCQQRGFRSDLPMIVYAVGSPNFIKERHGALYMAESVVRGELGDVQLLVRPHPVHDDAEMTRLVAKLGPRVSVQRPSQPEKPSNARFQDERQIREWVNTFRHADVVVNLSSTVAIDAAIFDRPVVNLDFDPEPGRPNQQLVKDVNHLWTHFKPIAESGGLWMVESFEEMLEAVRTYLVQPELHRAGRRWIAEYVCGFLDGRSGERLAQAIEEFVESAGETVATRANE